MVLRDHRCWRPTFSSARRTDGGSCHITGLQCWSRLSRESRPCNRGNKQKGETMKSASMTWGLSLLLAICLTPNFRSVASRILSPQPPIVFAQDEPPVALPGSADAQSPEGGDDNGPDAGQDQNAAPDE